LDRSNGVGISNKDKRGKHAPGIKKSEEVHKRVHDHIASFPCLESHYSRASSSKKYLEANLNISKMHQLYVNQCKENEIEPALASYYRHIFDTEFNLGFHKPKKDYCTFCHKYDNSSEAEKTLLQAEYDAHQIRKNQARSAKEAYKVEAQQDVSLVVATFDLQAVLPSPKLSASSVYYKRKLSAYNLTAFSLADRACTCYMWHEGTAGRGSSDIASCMLKFLEDQPETTKKVVLFSDTCGGQNRNKFFCTMVLYALHNSANITQVDHLYMESGHSQMECDSVHACIEREIRKQNINAPMDYYAAVEHARKPPYNVLRMDTDDFKDFSGLTKQLIRNRTKDDKKATVHWLNIKHFRYLKGESGKIFFKYDTDTNNTTFRTLNITQGRGRRTTAIPVSLPPLYTGPVKISVAKYRDLIDLCESKIIHRDYHSFYRSLCCDTDVPDCLPETDVDDTDIDES